MDYALLKQLDAKYTAAMAPEDAAAYFAVPETRPKPWFLSYRSILWIIKDPARLETLRNAVAAQYPTVDAMLSQLGNADGSAGGIDVSVPETQAFINDLVSSALLTQTEADALIALGLETVPRAVNLGLDVIPAPAQIRRVRSTK